MSFHMVLNSDKSLNHFPDNKPCHFRTVIKIPLVLRGIWKVALLEIGFQQQNPIHQNLYIYCSVCSGTIVDGEVTQLLRRLYTDDHCYYVFELPHYVDVIKTEVNVIEIQIRDDTGQIVTLLTQPVSLTLQFKAYPFLM